MAAPQTPGQPAPQLPLVEAALGAGGPAPLVDLAVGSQQQPAAPQIDQRVPLAPAVAEAPAPSPIVTRGGQAYLRDEQGALFAVPAELADRYVYEQGLVPATTEEVDRRLLEKEQEGFVGGAAAAGKAFVRGLYGVGGGALSGLAGLGYAATGSEFLKDFARETAPSNLFPTISAVAGGGLSSDLESQRSATEAESRARATQTAQQNEWPTLSTAAEAAGLIAGSAGLALGAGAALGGAARLTGVGSQALRGATAAELALGGTALRQGAIGVAEGVLQGAALPFNDGGTPTQQEVLTSALLTAALSGGIAAGGTAIARRLSDTALARGVAKPTETLEDLQAKVFRKPRVANEVADDIARRADPDAPPGAGVDAVVTKEYFDSLQTRVKEAVEAAGPNPKAMRDAADRAVAEMQRVAQEEAEGAVKNLGGRIDADNWKGIAPQYRPLLKDEIIEGATMDLERTHNALLNNTKAVEEFLKDGAQKAEKVRANLAASQVDDALAMRAAYATLEDFKKSFGDALMQRSREVSLGKKAGPAAREVRPLEPDMDFWSPYKSRIKSIEYTIQKADEAFGNAKDAADAYIVLDQVRREIAAHVSGLARSAVSDNPLLADPARLLQKWSKDEYLGRFVSHLGDAHVWGKQGAAQSSVNLAWRDKIDASYLGNISTKIGDDFGAPVYVADPEKARTLLAGIDKGQRSLRRDKLTDYYDGAEAMARAVLDHYDLTPVQRKAAETVAEKARAAREILETVNRQSSALTEKVVSSLMGRATAATAGIFAGGFAAGPVGSILGAIVLPVVQETAKNIVRRVAVATSGKATQEAAAGLAGAATRRAARKLGPEYVEQLNAKALGLGVSASGILFESTRDKPQKERFDIYEKRREALATLTSSPMKAQDVISGAIGTMAEKRPTMAGLVGMQLWSKLRALQEEFPGLKTISPIAAQRRTTASYQEIKKSEALWEAATDPTSVFSDFESGHLDWDKVRFSQRMYPEMWNLYRAAVIDQLAALPADAKLSSRSLVQIDMLMGFNGALAPSVAPDFSQRVDGYNQQLAEQRQPRPGGNLNLPTAQPTITQRIGRSA